MGDANLLCLKSKCLDAVRKAITLKWQNKFLHINSLDGSLTHKHAFSRKQQTVEDGVAPIYPIYD